MKTKLALCFIDLVLWAGDCYLCDTRGVEGATWAALGIVFLVLMLLMFDLTQPE